MAKKVNIPVLGFPFAGGFFAGEFILEVRAAIDDLKAEQGIEQLLTELCYQSPKFSTKDIAKKA